MDMSHLQLKLKPKHVYTTKDNTGYTFFKIQYITYSSRNRMRALITWFAINKEEGKVEVTMEKMWQNFFPSDAYRFVDITDKTKNLHLKGFNRKKRRFIKKKK